MVFLPYRAAPDRGFLVSSENRRITSHCCASFTCLLRRNTDLTAPGEDRMDPQAVERLYREHASSIRAFLIGLLRSSELAEEVQQSVFAKALEMGHTAQPTKFRGWLFRVANNEAMLLRRRERVNRRAIESVGRRVGTRETEGSVLERVSSAELSDRVQKALAGIPREQQEVVRLRVYEGLKFAEIAEQTGVPLGTVLTRMRLALGRLSKALPNDNE